METLKKSKKNVIDAFMRENDVSAEDLQNIVGLIRLYGGIPLLDNGEKLELELRYENNTLSHTFNEGVKIKAVHVLGTDIYLQDAPIPLPYNAAVQFCRQAGGELMTETDAQLISSVWDKIQSVLKQVIGKPLLSYIYWIDARASKPHLAKAFNFATGQIKEYRKNESFRVRPVNH